MAASIWLLTLSFTLFNIVPLFCNGGMTCNYVRNSEPSVDMPIHHFPPPAGYNAPEQRSVLLTSPGFGPLAIKNLTLPLRSENMNRYHVPYRASGSTSPLWYSIKRASAYLVVLSSYSAYGKYTPQYNWLEQEFKKINRAETPWLIVLLQSPVYNSNNYHYMEGESMRVMFEPWFVQNKVDIVFSGHVHSYERSERVSNVKYNIINGLSAPVRDASAPVYITIGDGGNVEGIANNYSTPQPSYSAYREASFGHAVLRLKTAHMPITLRTVTKTTKELFLQILLGFIIECGIQQKSTALVRA